MSTGQLLDSARAHPSVTASWRPRARARARESPPDALPVCWGFFSGQNKVTTPGHSGRGSSNFTQDAGNVDLVERAVEVHGQEAAVLVGVGWPHNRSPFRTPAARKVQSVCHVLCGQ